LKNLILPGNPRYQPKQMKEIFDYDNLYRGLARVEIATLETLHKLGFIPSEDFAGFENHKEALLEISTSSVDQLERIVTKHDVRAWVRIAQEIVGPKLARWVHVPLTSYDVLDTGRVLQYLQAYHEALRPSLYELVEAFIELVERFAAILQIGRTHGQHALPITVGFWLATILQRIIYNWESLHSASLRLVGKISGAVGAHNAQLGTGIEQAAIMKTGKSFESLVLEKLGLKPAPISTQILPPEPVAYFLFAATMLSAAFGQFARDCRQLMRSEITEIAEEFEAGQIGSSTMAHKRNPINFENIEGMWLRTKNMFGNVLDTLLSEHQRDLVGSSPARDFPVILINLQQQLNTLLRKNKEGVPFLKRITVKTDACWQNFAASANVLMAEPIYVCLQMAGYKGDAHALVNEKLMPLAQAKGITLAKAMIEAAASDMKIAAAIGAIDREILETFRQSGPLHWQCL